MRDAVLRSQTDWGLRELAEDICADIRQKDYLSECIAHFNWTKAHTRYMRDPRTVELVKSPTEVVREFRAGRKPQLDCDDMTALVAALCSISGADVRVVTVAFDNTFYGTERQYSHIFAEANVGGTWIVLDPVPVRVGEMLSRVVAAKVWPIG